MRFYLILLFEVKTYHFLPPDGGSWALSYPKAFACLMVAYMD